MMIMGPIAIGALLLEMEYWLFDMADALHPFGLELQEGLPLPHFEKEAGPIAPQLWHYPGMPKEAPACGANSG